MNLEDAMEKILSQQDELKTVNDENSSLKIKNENLENEVKTYQAKVEELKRLNMKYFERLTMETITVSETPSENDNITKESPSWDEFLNQW